MKTVYHRLKDVGEMRPQSLNTHGTRSTTIWSTVWKANTLPKIKKFTWRFLTNSLLVMSNLRRRGKDVLQGCLMCEMLGDVDHMIYRCNWTKPLWFGELGLVEQQHDKSAIGDWLQDRRDEHNAVP